MAPHSDRRLFIRDQLAGLCFIDQIDSLTASRDSLAVFEGLVDKAQSVR